MNYPLEYKNKWRTAAEAVELIEPGDSIFLPICAGEPPALVAALPDHTKLQGNTLYKMLSLYPLPEVEEEKLRIISLFLASYERAAFLEKRIDLLPNHFSELPFLLKKRTTNRVIMATVSPMDEQGYFSMGTNCDYIAPLLQDAKLILLEVNQHMPRTYGKNQIHISQVAALTENHVPLPTLDEPVMTEQDEKIGRIVSELIQNGDTLQIGFGAIPNAIMNFLKDHKDLGVFTEMLPDKIVDLYQTGVITNRQNPLCPGKTTMTFAYGSQRLYDFMHENPDLYMLPVTESNDIRIISQIDSLVSINATIEVDFLGQCNSETIGGKYYSSTGGQSDFAKGARLAKHGRGIICLHSTAKNETVSRIVPTLPPGAAVSTSKNDVDIIVTEYGMAELRNKTIRERTRALIGIAHPKFREELEFQARKMGYLI